MEIEVHQRGGILGMDRRYVVKDGTIEVIDSGRSRGRRKLAIETRARIARLADSAAGAAVDARELVTSDTMLTDVAIVHDNQDRQQLHLRSGDGAPAVVWDLIGEVSRAGA
jgi:hypothetical protein